MARVDMVHVPYKGNAAALTDLMGGQVSLSFPTMPSALPLVRSGKLRALGVTSAKRSAAAPDIPTLAESGLAGYEATSWYGMLAPAGTPPPIVERLHQTLSAILRSPDMKEKLASQGLEPVGNTPPQFAATLKSVLVQPSVYGTDNSLVLDALAANRFPLRAIAVVRDNMSTSSARVRRTSSGGGRSVEASFLALSRSCPPRGEIARF